MMALVADHPLTVLFWTGRPCFDCRGRAAAPTPLWISGCDLGISANLDCGGNDAALDRIFDFRKPSYLM